MHRKPWLLSLLLLLSFFTLPACAAETDDTTDGEDEDVAETIDPLTVGPTWKMATLIFTKIDAGYVTGGHAYHARGSMSSDRLALAKTNAAGVKDKWQTYNGGRALASMTTIVVPEAITHLSFAGSDISTGYWVAPSDVAAQLDKYAPKGKFDSVFVIWDPSIGAPDIPVCCTWGRGPGDDTNGMTYGAVHPNTLPEAIVHEWLHGAGAFYRDHGLDVPDPHENRIFGYTGPNSSGSWGAWYTSLMRGRLLRGGDVVGYESAVWRSGTPRRWIGGTYPGQSKPALAAPTLRKAETSGDWVYLEWKPVTKTSHYTEILTIRKPDGSHGASVSKYERPGSDRGTYDYSYFTKASLCDAARRSGVDLGAVRIGFQIWPDRQVASASNMNVSGSFDCR